MNARTLTNGLALTATLLFATSAMATSASPDSSVGNTDDLRPGFKSDTVTYQPTRPDNPGLDTNLLDGRVIYDPNNDLGENPDQTSFRVMALRYVPITFKWLAGAIH